MTTTSTATVVTSRLEDIEQRIRALEARLTEHLVEDLGSLDKRTAVLEERSANTARRMEFMTDELSALRHEVREIGVAMHNSVNEVKEMLSSHTISEDRDRLLILGGVVMMLVGVIGNFIWEKLV